MRRVVCLLVLVFSVTCARSQDCTDTSSYFGRSTTGGAVVTCYKEWQVSSGTSDIDIALTLGPGFNTLALLRQGTAGDRAVGTLTVLAEGPSNSYLVVSVGTTTFPTYRLSRIDNVIAYAPSTDWQPIIVKFLNIGQIGTTANDFVYSSGFADGQILHDPEPSYGYTGNVHAHMLADGAPGGRVGESGKFEGVLSIQGSLFGDILSLGTMDFLTVGGDIGSATIRPTISVQNLVRIEAQNMNADVVTLNSSGDDALHDLTLSGDLKGSITCTTIQKKFTFAVSQGIWSIGGHCDADITVRGRVYAENTGAPATIIIGGDLKAGRTLSIGTTLSGGASGVGGIRILGNQGLKGQIDVNDTATSGAWEADIVVDDVNGTPVVLDPQAAAGAYYATTSAALGGGAVGLAPVHLHNADCDPPNTPTTPPIFRNSQFCHIHDVVPDCGGSANYADQSAVLTFYGKVARESSTVMPITCFADGNTTTDYAQFMVAEIISDGTTRRLRVYGDPAQQVQFIPGRYRIKPKLTGTARLLNAGLHASSPVPVADFEYVFDIHADCNRNGVNDATDITNGWTDTVEPYGVPDCCHGYPVCDSDYNQDGVADQDDVAYLTNVIAGGANPT